MRCETMEQGLDAYRTKGLAPQIQAQFERHLADCRSCRETLARLERLAILLGSDPAPPVPQGMAGRIMAEARRQFQTPQSVDRKLPSLLRWWQSLTLPMQAAAAVVLAVGLAAGAWMGRDTGQGSSLATSTTPSKEYSFDYLSEAPAGSLVDAYLRLTLAQN
ncbi:MAG: hypothetical protein ABFD16_25060 [Thermoguttaceae bacterium]